MQLTHGGGFADKNISGEQQLAPSAVFNPAGFDFPKEMTPHDMDVVCAQFVFSAKVCERAGFDAIELHCGHGYLLSQWLSPFTNRFFAAFLFPRPLPFMHFWSSAKGALMSSVAVCKKD